MIATFTQLKSGDWGLRVHGIVAEGAEVVVSKRDGSRQTKTIGKVLWTGDGVSLCTIAGASKPSRYGSRRGSSMWHCNCSECQRGSESTCLRDWGRG